MKRFAVFICLFIFCECTEDSREPKFFFGPKVQTVHALRKVPEFVTEFVPSSCIVIEPTLPPCRHVRSLEIYPSVPTRIAKTQTPQIQKAPPPEAVNWKPVESVHHVATPPLRGKPQQVKFTSPYWNWNLFNIFRVQNFTYTSTKTEYVTTRVEDPNTVVSFYVKGCRPSKLPFNLPECARPEDVKKEEKNIVVMAPLKFVPNVDSLITPSKSEHVIKLNDEEEAEEEEEQQHHHPQEQKQQQQQPQQQPYQQQQQNEEQNQKKTDNN